MQYNIQQTIFSNITTLNISTSTTSQHSDTISHFHAITLVWSLRHIHLPTFTPLDNVDYSFPFISPNLCTILFRGHYTVPSNMSTQPGHSKNGIRLCTSKYTLPKSTHPHENPIIHLLQPTEHIKWPTCHWTPHSYDKFSKLSLSTSPISIVHKHSTPTVICF